MSQNKQAGTVPNKTCVDTDIFIKNATNHNNNNNTRNQGLKSSTSLKKSFLNNSILPNYGEIFLIGSHFFHYYN